MEEEERIFNENFDKLVPVSGEERARIEAILEEGRKKRAISLRISEADLHRIKVRAGEEGLPYQTLITTILHKYATDQLYDMREVRKTFSLARENGFNFE